jgi:hypothetical protein
MKLATSLRSGGVLWATPFVLLLTIFYYNAGETRPLSEFHDWAPALVASPLMMLYALAYTVAACLAAWESGRISVSGIWQLAPSRSRFRIAANILTPVILLSWAVLLTPPTISLIRAATLPTTDSLRLPVMAMVLCLAHAAIGFAVGLRLPRLFAAPIVAVMDFVLVAFTRAVHPYWLRHVSGQYTDVGFGEVPGLSSVVAPILFGGGLAAGVALLWAPLRHTWARSLLACLVAAGCMSGAYRITEDWGHDPALVTGQASTECRGHAPQVCMPTATASALPSVRSESVSALNALRARGLEASPTLITDRLSDGRGHRRSTETTWRLPLTTAAEQGTIRYQIAMAAVRFPCTRVNTAPAQAAQLWATSVVGEEKRYVQRMAGELPSPDTAEANRQIQNVVKQILAEPTGKQSAWFEKAMTAACSRSGT